LEECEFIPEPPPEEEEQVEEPEEQQEQETPTELEPITPTSPVTPNQKPTLTLNLRNQKERPEEKLNVTLEHWRGSK